MCFSLAGSEGSGCGRDTLSVQSVAKMHHKTFEDEEEVILG